MYEYFLYDGASHSSIASFGPDIFERTIVVNACSKSHSMTGLRIGYAAGPRSIMKLVDGLQGQVTSGASSVAQYMAIAALKSSKNDFAEIVSQFRKKRDFALSLLEDVGLAAIAPKGAFYIFLPIMHLGVGSEEFCRRLIDEEKVAAVPGVAFGREGYVRISYATSEENLAEGIRRMGALAGRIKAD